MSHKNPSTGIAFVEGPAVIARKLQDYDQRLPDSVRADIAGLGPAAVPELLDVLQNQALQMQDSPGGGHARIHAAELLGELRAADAVNPLLKVLADTDHLEVLHDRALTALGQLGAPALEPALAAYNSSDNEDYRSSLLSVVARLGVRDDRVFAMLVEDLERRPGWAGNLAHYGDPAALPYLSRALDDFQLTETTDNPMLNHEVVELVAAIEDLGGELTPSQQAKRGEVAAAADAFRQRLFGALGESQGAPVQQRRKIGRNQPCWCGSGKKYKKCHEAEDEGRGS